VYFVPDWVFMGSPPTVIESCRSLCAFFVRRFGCAVNHAMHAKRSIAAHLD
jgi:hypothetical protein